MKYLKVNISSRYGDEHVYERLDDLTEYSEKDLQEICHDMVNNVYSWGYSVVDEDVVPEDER